MSQHRLDPEPRNQPLDALEQAQREKYRGLYAGQPPPARDPKDYFTRQYEARIELVRRYYAGGTVLDLCCGQGHYLPRVAEFAERVLGVDFSPEMLHQAKRLTAERACGNVELVLGNANSLPLVDCSIELIYCFSSLYTIPRYQRTVSECARVLVPGGLAILDFGIRESLNTLVCRASPDLAVACHVPLRDIHRTLRGSGFGVEEDRAYQILPLWGSGPWWLRPLLHPFWRWLMGRRVGGRMVDEWLSNASVSYTHLTLPTIYSV